MSADLPVPDETVNRGDASVRLRTALWRLDGYLTARGEVWSRFDELFADDVDVIRRARTNLDTGAELSTTNLMAAVGIAERLVACAEKAEETEES